MRLVSCLVVVVGRLVRMSVDGVGKRSKRVRRRSDCSEGVRWWPVMRRWSRRSQSRLVRVPGMSSVLRRLMVLWLGVECWLDGGWTVPKSRWRRRWVERREVSERVVRRGLEET